MQASECVKVYRSNIDVFPVQINEVYDAIENNEYQDVVFKFFRELNHLNQHLTSIEQLVESSGENATSELIAVKVLQDLLQEKTCEWVRIQQIHLAT